MKNNNHLHNKRVINLSIDEKLFSEGSAVSKRFIEYGKVFKELHVVVYTKRGFKEKKIASNVFLYPTNTFLKPLYFRRAFNISKRLVTTDTIVTSQEAFTHIVAIKLKKQFGVKINLQYHTDFMSPYFKKESFKNRIKHYLYIRSLVYADSIRVVSDRVKKSIEHIAKAPIHVLPLFVDIPSMEAALSTSKIESNKYFPQFQFKFLVASRLEKEKNIDMLIEAFYCIVCMYPKTGLVIVGDGSQKSFLEKRVRELGIERNVVFEGWKDNLTPYYLTSNTFLLGSNYEGHGLTLVEAMVAGLPIITTNVGIVGELLTSENGILVCNVGDRDCFVKNMNSVIEDKLLCEQIKMSEMETVKKLKEPYGTYMERYKESFSTIV